ncbi:MAG: ABC transporter substrate-binding protein [Bradymonadia bacterium]|jgi:multiple sugar transport system substrate-binding protein
MKTLFLALLGLLLVATGATWLSLPEQITGKPVLYWVSDPNPVRVAQVEAFHVWMKTNVPEQDHFELRLDAANNSPEKKVIQSVSGVGGDVMDVFNAGEMQYYRAMGILEDLTDRARAGGYTPDRTSAVIAPQLSVEGRQYMFPCNMSASMYWVNAGALAKFGLQPPRADWLYDDFEREGLAFVTQANAGLEHRRFFYASQLELIVLLRDRGLDTLNETMTASTLDHPLLLESLERLRRWRHELHILPSQAEMQSINTESAHGGSEAQLFRTGNIPLHWSGRWALCQFRLWDDFKSLQLAVAPPPASPGGFRNSVAYTRAAVMYAGSKHKRLAEYFFKYLASPAYSQTIVESADAMPPLPESTQTEAYRKPAEFPNEWGVHEAFATSFEAYGVPKDESPFVTSNYCDRELADAEAAVMAVPPLYTPAEAARRAQRRINERIALNLRENPGLRPAYEAAVADQARIDALKAQGQKLPRALIRNAYHLRYLTATGLLEGDAP